MDIMLRLELVVDPIDRCDSIPDIPDMLLLPMLD